MGADRAALEADLAANPAIARAEHLLRIGMREEATWELEAVIADATEKRSAPALHVLADWLEAHGLFSQSMQVGRTERDVLAEPISALPNAVQRQVYPTGWGALAFTRAAEVKVDPLLLLGLVRQESGFAPAARSSANALGLTQVVAETGQDIARALGQTDTFNSADLYRPTVSLEYGAYYLSQQLKTFDGDLFEGLAAYNSGAGNAAAWEHDAGGDPDLYVERIAFAETQNYVKLVYENYRNYQRIYAR